jgi:hypothetical protein
MVICAKILRVAYQMKVPVKSFNWYKNELSVLIRTSCKHFMESEYGKKLQKT